MGNCCASDDNVPYEPELNVPDQQDGMDAVTAPLTENTALDTPQPSTPPIPSAVPSDIPSDIPSSGVPESAPAVSEPEASGMEDNSAKPFVLDIPSQNTSSSPRPGARSEEDFSALPPAETRMTGGGGFALIYSETAGGTLVAKWVQNGPPPSCVAFLRITDAIDDLKLYNQPFQCGRSVRQDWMNQAKAIAVFIKQCWTFEGELELLPEFNTLLPRRASIVFHCPDMTMKKVSAPAAIDTPNGAYDACAVMPHVSDTFKGQSTLKTTAFLEKAVRRGATIRF